MLTVGCGAWLTWRYLNAGTSIASLLLGLTFLLFGLLLRSRPVTKPVDDLARELDALVVLNGGAFSTEPEMLPIQPAQIFVHPERLTVVGARERRLAEIPVSRIRSLSVHPVAVESSNGNSSWEVGIDWGDGEIRTAIFRYEGAFAEHLARVAESTVRGQWKKGLPVIPS